jgi:hypothetical protein
MEPGQRKQAGNMKDHIKRIMHEWDWVIDQKPKGKLKKLLRKIGRQRNKRVTYDEQRRLIDKITPANLNIDKDWENQ